MAEEDEAMRKGLKIGDLAPSPRDKRPGIQSLKTINFNVYIYEMPAENITALDEIWQMLYKEPLRFVDYEAFGANSFSVGFGQVQMWSEVTRLLDAGGGRKVRRVSLLLPGGQADDVAIAGLPREQTIFYIATDGSMDGRSIGPGRLGVRMKAEKIPGLRGVCNVNAWPVFTSPVRSAIPQLADRAKSHEFIFTSAGFGLKMSPGDFFLLGPEKYVGEQMTLGGYFFSKGAPSPGVRLFVIPPSGDTQKRVPYFGPVVRIYLVVCTAIND